MAFQIISDGKVERSKRFELVPVAGDESATIVFNVCQSAEAVVFQFEKPVRVIEWLRASCDRQRLEAWLHRLSISIVREYFFDSPHDPLSKLDG